MSLVGEDHNQLSSPGSIISLDIGCCQENMILRKEKADSVQCEKTI